MSSSGAAVERLLESPEPAIRNLVRRDVLGEDGNEDVFGGELVQALLVLSRMGLHGEPRAAESLELLAATQRRDGRWAARRTWWRPPGANGSNVEAVDWGERASEMVTPNALRVLQ